MKLRILFVLATISSSSHGGEQAERMKRRIRGSCCKHDNDDTPASFHTMVVFSEPSLSTVPTAETHGRATVAERNIADAASSNQQSFDSNPHVLLAILQTTVVQVSVSMQQAERFDRLEEAIESLTSQLSAVPSVAPSTSLPSLPSADAPRDEPTASPTDQPTASPMGTPTESATGNPTESPTDAPMDEPTASLTVASTESPSDSPTRGPSPSSDSESKAQCDEEKTTTRLQNAAMNVGLAILAMFIWFCSGSTIARCLGIVTLAKVHAEIELLRKDLGLMRNELRVVHAEIECLRNDLRLMREDYDDRFVTIINELRVPRATILAHFLEQNERRKARDDDDDDAMTRCTF